MLQTYRCKKFFSFEFRDEPDRDEIEGTWPANFFCEDSLNLLCGKWNDLVQQVLTHKFLQNVQRILICFNLLGNKGVLFRKKIGIGNEGGVRIVSQCFCN